MNYKSIGPLQIINLRNDGSDNRKNGNIFNHMAAIFGANSSGKSNIIDAIKYGKKIISTTGVLPVAEEIYCKFDDKYKKYPTIFEYEMCIGNKSYSYLIEMMHECNRNSGKNKNMDKNKKYLPRITRELITDITPVKTGKKYLPANKIVFEYCSGDNNPKTGGKSKLDELLNKYSHPEDYYHNRKSEAAINSDEVNLILEVIKLEGLGSEINEIMNEIDSISAELKEIDNTIKKIEKECEKNTMRDRAQEIRLENISKKYDELNNVLNELRAKRAVKEKEHETLKNEIDKKRGKINRVPNILSLLYLPSRTYSNKKNLNREVLTAIRGWFSYTLNIVSPKNNLLRILDEQYLKKLTEVVHNFSVGIDEFKLVSVDSEDEKKEIMKKLEYLSSSKFETARIGSLEHVQSTFISTDISGIYQIKMWLGSSKVEKLITVHDGMDFEIFEESDGTRRLIELAPLLMDNDDDQIYVIDELDRCMHTELTKSIVEGCMKKKQHKQLIISSHEPDLLSDTDSFSDDELWFVERVRDRKSPAYGSSIITSYRDKCIPEYLPRKQAFEKGYTGGTPIIK